MAIIDFITDLVALFLWLSWLSVRFDPLVKTSAASLVGTLRKADPSNPKRWIYLTSLVLLILLRALVWWQICAPLHADPSLNLGIIHLPTRGDAFGRMLLFSFLSFAQMLAGFYFWVLLISAANSKVPDTDPFQKMVRLYVNRSERWPGFVKLLLPFLVGATAWLVLHPVLAWLRILPPAKSTALLFEQAALVGAAAYLMLKYLIVGILLLHLLNSYVYLGNQSFWNFVNATARNLLHPLRWLPLRVGKMDFLPVAAIAMVLLLAEGFRHLHMPF
jgi:uncharacterized protein YggT (Ycf19 family)